MRLFSTPESCSVVTKDSLPHSNAYKYCRADRIELDMQIGSLVWVFVSSRKRSNAAAANRFYKRARVLQMVDLPENRVRVLYPASGSTYDVRRERLQVVMEHERGTVLVYPETTLYRRGCIMHCLPNETFYEIGCDRGETCRKVKNTGDQSRTVVGIDKSKVSVAAAQTLPECHFVCLDMFDTEATDNLLNDLDAPDVIAIDINGNRELEAVLKCLDITLQRWTPRLVLVKSRTLYFGLSLDGDDENHSAKETPGVSNQNSDGQDTVPSD